MPNLLKVIVMLVTIILGGGIIYVCGLTLLTVFALGYGTYRDSTQWRERTKPLEPEVVADICEKFDLQEDDPRCQPDATVYAPDFFGVIRDAFQPSDGDWATYDEVEEKLGEYRLRRGGSTDTTSDGVEYFRCWYDLQGDQAYPIIIWFYGDGSMWKMSTDMGD